MRVRTPTTEFDAGSDHVVSLSSPARGDACGGWRLLELLGLGGTAEVWRAVDGAGREAALKILKPELRRRPGASAVLRREFTVLTAAAGLGLVEPLELVGDGAALALEYLPGGDLVPLLGAPARQWLPASHATATALAALHERGIAHGDVKARNVRFAADGTSRLTDLATARAIDLPAVPATAAYRAPGKPTAREADAFAFAALVYELCVGRPPYGDTGASHMGATPPAAVPADRAAVHLLAAATVVLRGGGGGPKHGLSRLADVIESVDAF